ncbi:hypothetical protein [Pseudonocardia sp. GCM10023141]|uniref:hypothetical protein n=1 Tax=Pseudonocardia sp. GCM10023141 TaxID=3252653 RepID=UPI0036207D48
MRKPIEQAVVVAGLRALAEEMELGLYPTPVAGQGLRQIKGATLVPLVIHDALCGWRVASMQDDIEPPTCVCAGCGLAFLGDEARGRA